jgi:hypothetical protein
MKCHNYAGTMVWNMVGALATIAAKAWILVTGVNEWERPAGENYFVWALMLVSKDMKWKGT